MLYGRSAEMARIDELLDAARTGRSAALVVRGGPGVGKSALLDYAAERATGLRVLRCTGIESEAELAFAALHCCCVPASATWTLWPSRRRPRCEARSGSP